MEKDIPRLANAISSYAKIWLLNEKGLRSCLVWNLYSMHIFLLHFKNKFSNS